MKKYLVFFILLINYFLLSGQEDGKPLIQTYIESEYNGHTQNWSITEDPRGIIYIGNQDTAIIEFDGTNFRHITTANASAVRSLATDSKGKIYVGAVDEFGYLEPNLQGIYQYKSLLHLTDTSHRNFGIVWSTSILNNKVFFQSSNSIFLYENGEIKHCKLPNTYHRGFVVNNNYYVRQEGIGLTVFKNDTFQLINNGEMFSNETISAMIPYSDTQILIGTRTKGLFLYDKVSHSIKTFPIKNNSSIKNSAIYHGVKIGKNRFAFATLDIGVFIINNSGEVLQTINKAKGMPSNAIYCLYNQNNESLWAGTESGIARIDIGHPIQYWDEDYGIDGSIYSMERTNDIFYVGSVISLSYWKPGDKSKNIPGRFNQVRGIPSGNVWDLIKFEVPCANKKEKYKLIAGTDDGLFEVKGTRARQIAKLKWCFRLHCPNKNPYMIFIASVNGLFQIKYNCKKDAWEPIEKLESFQEQIKYIKEDDKNNIWVAGLYNGYYRIKFNSSNENNSFENYSFKKPVSITNFKSNCGLPERTFHGLMKIDNNVGFLTSLGLYRFNGSTEQFYPDTLINNQLTSKTIVMATQDITGNLWFDSRQIFIKRSENKYVHDSIRLRRLVYGNFFHTFPDKNDDIWLGSKKLYKVNLNDTIIIKEKFSTQIRLVTVNNDSLLFGGTFFDDSNRVCLSQTEHLKPELNYQYNSITFEYSSPYFVEQDNIRYSFKLEGFDKNWSVWSPETKKEYTNLNQGNYTFKVKALNIYNSQSSLAKYEFTILTPIHKSLFAYICYFILLVLIVILIVKFYTKRLKQANIRLENIVRERTKVIVEKNKELAKLSIVASKTESSISILDANGNFEWVNDAFVRLHEYTLEEYIKVKGKNLINSSTNPDIKKIVSTCLKEKKPVIYQSLNISKSKENIWTQTSLTPILNDTGEIEKLVTIEADIRKIKEYEKEIEAQKEELAIQRDNLAEANATKDKFFSIISHDLKSPFNAILGFTEMLEENIPVLSKDKITKFNNQIFTSAKQLYNLVENLLSWSRAKSGKIESYPEKLDLVKLIDTTCSIMSINATRKIIQIKQNIPKNTFVFADENLISTVVRNLLSNAIKYSKENSIITVNAINKEKMVEISIIDSGIGIKREDIDKLFRENIHFTTQGTNQERGTGLGLILCKDFVEKCGGKIWVGSEQGKGTTFTFTLPKPKK